MTEPRRIFLGLTEIAGYYCGLARGFRQLGHDADLVTLVPHQFGYDSVAGEPAARMQRRVRKVLAATAGRGPLSVAVEGACRVALLLWALPRYDTFVFGFRNSFLIGWELRLLRICGKRTVCVFHGSDHRPPYQDGAVAAGLSLGQLARRTRSVKRLVQRFERGADVVVGNPLSAQFHELPLVAFQTMGTLALDAAVHEIGVPDPTGPIRILHAPSLPAAKGTPAIRTAIEDLRSEGFDVELVELTGRPNVEVLAELDSCSFVIDQLYSDTFLAGFAAEAAAAGKAAVVGGYGFDELERALPASEHPPGLRCHPDDLVATVRSAVMNPSATAEVGRAVQQFVHARWTPVQVAERFLRLIDGDAPDEWWYDPGSTTYDLGCCLSAASIDRIGSDLVARYGFGALCIDDKPRLLAAARRRFGSA